MIRSRLASLVRLMDDVIADVEVGLYEEISLSLLRISKEHPGKIVEFVYDPSRDTTWHVSVGLEPYKDEHLESCLKTASAYAGPVAVPPRHVQVVDCKFTWNRRFKRPHQLRDEPAKEEPIQTARKERDALDQ